MTTINASPAVMSTTSPDGSAVEFKLRKAWRKERRYVHLRGLAYFLLWAVAFVALDFLIDWLFRLPPAGRVALLVINAAVLVWVSWKQWFRHLRPYDPVRVALQVEKRHPGLKSLLVSYVQFQGRSDIAGSPALVRAMQEQAVDATRPLDFREIISYGELKRILVTCAAVLLLFALVSVRWDDYFRVLVARMLNPGENIAYPQRTRIDPMQRIVVRQGDNVPLEITVRGQAPTDGSLFVKPDGGAWERLPLSLRPDARGETRVYPYLFEGVYKSFKYYAKIGDAKSEQYDVVVIAPPQVEKTAISLRHPPYMKRKDRATDLLNFETPEGTNVTWTLTLDRPVASAQLLVGDERLAPATRPSTQPSTQPTPPAVKEIAMAISPDGRTITANLAANASTPYRFRFKEQAHGFEFTQESRHYVQVTPDLPPEVEVIEPGTDWKATVQKTLEIVFRANDDFGVTKVRIIYSFNDGPENIRDIPGFTGGTGTIQWPLKADLPDFKDGDLLVMSYSLEVEDNYPGEGGPHKSRSGGRTLQVVSIPEYQAWIQEMQARVFEEIESSRDAERKSQTEVRTIKGEPVLPQTRPVR